MVIALWIVSGLLALANLFAGAFKVVRPKEAFVKVQAWAADLTPVQLKIIGALEVLGALGLILPRLVDADWLSVAAAFGLAIVQAGAAVFHLRRRESPVVNLVFVALALFVAIGLLATS